MNLRKLKKSVQEKHGWWDTMKLKSRRDYADHWNTEYWATLKSEPKKYVFPPMYVSTGGKSCWRNPP